jgi:hypothetical protein
LVFLRSVRRLLVTTSVAPSSPIFVTLMKGAPSSSEKSVLTRAIRRNIPEDAILYKFTCSYVDDVRTSLEAHNFTTCYGDSVTLHYFHVIFRTLIYITAMLISGRSGNARGKA